MVQEPFLEGRDGAHSGRLAKLWKNHIRQRYRCKNDSK